MAIDLGLRIVQLLDSIGIKGGSYLGKASNVKKAFTGGKPTFFKPDVLETLRSQDGTFADALKLMEEEAMFIANATDAEKMAFLNNLMQYKSLGGPQKTKPVGIASTKVMDQFKKTQTELQKALKDLQSTTEKNKNKALQDLDDFFETGGQPFKKKDNKFLGGSMHEEGQLRTGIRQFLQTEYKNGRLKLNDLDKERIMQYSPMIEHDPILVFKKIYGDEAYTKAGSFPGAFEKGENFKHYEQIFRENMGDEILQIKNNEYKGDGKLVLTEAEEVFKPTPDDDPDIPFAEGGIAALLGEPTGYYTGGMVDVEPNLSDIGHGSDALMARTRLVSPNSQATTSTGLNYLLAEDNDNIRVPFSKGKGVDFARRGFLKVVGGTVGAIAALKSGALKLLGKTPKKIPKIIEIGKGSGVPEWFEPMVNKVLADGLDVTKGNAIVDGQTVKRIDTPNGQVDVYHNERSGEIDVEYASQSHAALGDSVHLNYKPSRMLADEGNPTPPDEFMASESIPEYQGGNPLDGPDLEMGDNTVDEVGGLFSDTSELEKLGGQNINMREILKNIQKKKKLKQMENRPAEFIEENYGPLPD